MSLGNETVETVEVLGVSVDVVGCWDEETPEGKYDFYDLFVKGECVNLGEPCYERPTKEDIRAFLEIWREMI